MNLEDFKASSLTDKIISTLLNFEKFPFLNVASSVDFYNQLSIAFASGHFIDGGLVGLQLTEIVKQFSQVINLDQTVNWLVKNKIVNSGRYWKENAIEGCMCNPHYVKQVLVALTVAFSEDSIGRERRVDLSSNLDSDARLQNVSPFKIRSGYDVIIVGAGTGGCSAAMQAAKMGSSVLLVEETDWVGGQMTAAGVGVLDEGGKLLRFFGNYGDYYRELIAHHKDLGVDPVTAYWNRHPAAEPRVGQELLLKLLFKARGSGVIDLLFRSRVTSVTKDRSTVTGVELQSQVDYGSINLCVKSQILIDATEWGDVIPMTGARYRVGNSTSENIKLEKTIQSITWPCVLRNYQRGLPSILQLDKPLAQYEEDVKYFRHHYVGSKIGSTVGAPSRPWGWDKFIGYRALPNVLTRDVLDSVNSTVLNFDTNDVHLKVAAVEMPAIRMVSYYKAIIKTLNNLYYIQNELGMSSWSVCNEQGYDSSFNRTQMDAMCLRFPDLLPYINVLYHFPVMPYVRESRRIIGLYTLSSLDISRKGNNPTEFPHTVAYGDYFVDLHGSHHIDDIELEYDRVEDLPTGSSEIDLGVFGIPLECFIPEEIDGFLPAEKNISQSRLVNGATRLQPSTILTGQAAGAIAALAVKHKIQPRLIDPQEVIEALTAVGALVNWDLRFGR